MDMQLCLAALSSSSESHGAENKGALLDRVNDLDEPIGVISRQDVFLAKAGFRVVHVFLLNSAGQILLQQLSPERIRNPLRWGSSVAGYVLAGESYSDASRRRLNEELGLSTPLSKLADARMFDEGAFKFVGLYVTRSETADNRLPEQIAALQFFPLEEISQRVREEPDSFTPTFRFIFEVFLAVRN